MMVRPTTEQLLLDCSKELMEGVLPAVSDPTAVVRLFMIEQVLRNAAKRCAHEIAWMLEEIPQLEAYGRDVLAVAPSAELAERLATLAAADAGNLELDAVVERYCVAGDILGVAVDLAITHGHDALRLRGEALLDLRLDRETDVMAGWNPTGR